MRLYLSIHRNSLPPVKTVWPLSESQQNWTIAQLLENVNETFPIEAEHWGLEDYIVLLAGYECIQHHEIACICKDEDELVIRPLQTTEVRARTLSGRRQISNAGRHLVDGVAFGKSALRIPVRPDIHIPPRKRRKLALEEEGNNNGIFMLEDGQQAQEEGGEDESEDESDDEDSDDSDFGDDEELAELSSDSGSSISSMSADEIATESTSSDSISTSSEESDSDSDSSISSSELQKSTVEDDRAVIMRTTLSIGSKPSFQGQRMDDSTYDDRETGLAVSQVNHGVSSAAQAGVPYEGAEQTRYRNKRRRAKKRLDFLKQQGELPQSATFSDLADYDSRPSPNHALLKGRQKELLQAIASGGIDISDHHFGSAVESGQYQDINDDEDEPPEQYSTRGRYAEQDNQEISLEAVTTSDAAKVDSTALIPSAVIRRAKLDLAGSKRLLFGSLGVKVPRTDEEKASLRSKLAGGLKKGHGRSGTHPPTSNGIIVDNSEDWRSRIVLSAVECCDAGVVLSTPSFPFQQRWDPQYHNNRKRKLQASDHASYKSKGAGYYAPTERYDKYNTSGHGDILNYDDVADPTEDGAELLGDDDYWEEGALLDGDDNHEMSDDDGEAQDDFQDDGFPPLPEDVTTLPKLAEEDAKPGDFVVYSELTCSADTKWQPLFTIRSVQLLHKTVDGWDVKRALRDLGRREYDTEGNRVYKKFDMAGMSDDEGEGDDDQHHVDWRDLITPALLLRTQALN